MTAPRPLTEADRAMLADVIAKRWPACRAEARLRDGTLPWLSTDGYIGGAPGRAVDEGGARALAILADDLEGDPLLCLDIAREPGKPPRVLGWATAEAWRGAARIRDLDIRDPARLRRDDRIHEERMARRAAMLRDDERRGSTKIRRRSA